MTSLALARRRLSFGIASFRPEVLAVVLILLGLGAAFLFAFRAPAEEPGDAATVKLTPAKMAALVASTSAAPAQIRAFGEKAKLINASLPFSQVPLQAAAPFEIGGSDLTHQRALLCLTQAVYYEAGFEPLAGRRAVAQVVLNRMRHPAFPKSVCGVVYQGSRSPVCQFSFVCDGSLYRAPAAAAWRQARDVAAAALAGYVEQSVGSATHYHADYVSPRWAPMLTKISQLGAHIFYRWPGSWGQRAAFTGRYVGEPQDPLSMRPAPRQAQPVIDGAATIAEAVVEAGPPIARAPNDVGGLLDTSKGWTLKIPMPDEVSGASKRALAEQRQEQPVAVAANAAPAVASR